MSCLSHVDGIVCGGHGSCNSIGRCICDTLWTSRGDFEFEYYNTCDISLTFVKSFSVMIILTCAVQAVVAAYNIATFDVFKWSALFKIFQPKLRISILLFLCSLGGIVYGTARLADPINNVIGGEVASSVGFVSFFVFGDIGWVLLSVVFANFLKKSSKVFRIESQEKIGKMVEVTKTMCRFLVLNLFIIISPIAAALKPSKSDSVLITIYILWGIFVSSQGAVFCWVVRTFNAEIGEYINTGSASPDFIVLQQRTVLLFYGVLYVFTLPFAPVCMLMAAWPYLRRKFTYFIMLNMFCSSVTAVLILLLQIKEQKLPSGNKNKVYVQTIQTRK